MNKKIEFDWQELINYFPHNNPNPVFLVDGDGTVVYANSASKPIKNFWKKNNFNQIVCPYIEDIRLSLQQNILIQSEKQVNEVLYAFSFNPTACSKGVYIFVQEISQKREQEKTLNLYSEIIKHLSEGIFMVGMDDGIITYCNPNFGSQLGYASDEIIGIKANSLLAGDEQYLYRVSEQIKDQLTQAGRWQGELKAVRKNAEEFWCHLSLSKLEYLEYGEVVLGVLTDINARKLAEKAFKEEKEKAQLYLDIARVMIIVVGIDEKVHLINKMGCRVLGYDEGDIIGKNWFDNFLPKSIKDEAKAYSKKIIAGDHELINDYESSILTASGKERIISWHNTPLYNKHGRITGYLRSGSDVTNQRAIQAQVKQFKTFADMMHDSLFIFSPDDLHFIYANKQATINVGYSQAELMQMTPLDIKPRFDKKSFNNILQALQQTEDKSTTFETVHLHKQGNLIPVEITLQYISPKGEPPRYNALVRDISTRKIMEKRLNLAHKIIEGTSDAVLVTDLSGKILDVNSAFTTITGYKRHEVIGQNPRIGKSGHQDANFYKNMWKHIINDGHWSGEIWDRKATGEVYPKLLTINTIYDEDAKPQYYTGIFSDISHIKDAENKLHNIAYYDGLTGLPNRSLFQDRLSHELTIAKREQKSCALLYIDLDKFKDVNDTLGHKAGDLLLIQAAKRIQNSLRESDTVARIGGDEFTVLLSGSPSEEVVGNIAQDIIQLMKPSFTLEDNQIYIGATIGIAFYPKDGNSEDELYKYADLAMYQAKAAGRNCFRFFTATMNEKVLKHIHLEKELHEALEKKEFQLYYQPKISLENKQLIGFEALIRWQHSDKGLVSPVDFIPVAEGSNLIVAIGDWVIQNAFAQLKQWNDTGYKEISLAINIASRQLHETNFIEQVKKYLRLYQIPANQIEFEITESMLMEDIEKASQCLGQLKKIGIRVAIDDFGTGYSSLAYLKHFPIDTLKIDQSFVQYLKQGSRDAAIVDTIIAMAHNLDLQVVAEGVENREQEQYLFEQECDLGQGYLFARPMGVAGVEAYLSEWYR